MSSRPEADRRFAVWTARLAGRAVQLLGVIAAVVVITFLLVHLVPGDPARTILGTRATPQSLAALRHEMGIDQPLLRQFGSFVSQLAHGDLGNSLVLGGRPVADIILPDFAVTLSVVACSVLFAILLGIPLGLWAALSRYRPVDSVVRSSSVLLLSMPPFFVGLLLLLFVSLDAGLAPAGGWGGGWPDNARYVWLPSLALAAYLIPITARAVRQTAHETVREHFIEAATARGLPSRTVTLRHVLPNSVLPVITLLGFNMGALIGGAVVIEAVFALPGVGTDLVNAVATRDYPVVQGVALLTAIFVVLINFATDAIYALVDPRILNSR